MQMMSTFRRDFVVAAEGVRDIRLTFPIMSCGRNEVQTTEVLIPAYSPRDHANLSANGKRDKFSPLSCQDRLLLFRGGAIISSMATFISTTKLVLVNRTSIKEGLFE